MIQEPYKPDMPEWLRVIAIFVITFALMVVLGGLVGIQAERQDDPAWAAAMHNQP